MDSSSTSPVNSSPVNSLSEEYIQQLTPLQLKALNIAISHLGTSFNIFKSNGYIEWKKSNKK